MAEPQLPSPGALLERSVFLTQLLFAGATLLLVAVTAVAIPHAISDPVFFAGIFLVFVATGLAAVVPWHALPGVSVALLPICDIVGICLVRGVQPSLGAAFLLVFPVIWMSTQFRVRGAVVSVTLSAGLVWAGATMTESALRPDEIPRLAVVPIILVFVAATTCTTTSRTVAHRNLLTQQAELFEAALRRSRRQERTLAEIFNAVDFGVVGFDSSGKANVVNRAQREMLARFGTSATNPVPDVIYGEDRVTPIAEADRPYIRALRGEAVDRDTVWVGAPDDVRAALLVSARPVLDERGAFDGGVLVSRDVTAEMRAIQARDDLVASVSHELRTPLTSILGYLELSLDDTRLDPATRRMLDVASSNADRLLALVADLLTAASDSKNLLMVAFAPCDLSTIVRDAIESIRPLAAERDIAFEVKSLPAITLNADAFRLRQVVDNLLSNSVKYNVHAGRITVTLATTGTQAELRITDTGRGMTADEQRNLFDRFYRADSVRGSNVHGTGLGLNISRDIVQKHGGALRIESTSGIGTTAVVTVPVAP